MHKKTTTKMGTTMTIENSKNSSSSSMSTETAKVHFGDINFARKKHKTTKHTNAKCTLRTKKSREQAISSTNGV